MSRISAEDHQEITHINFICDRIHDSADEIYEALMDREHEEVKNIAKDLVRELNALIISVSDEV